MVIQASSRLQVGRLLLAITMIAAASVSLPVWAQSTPPAPGILPTLPFAPGEDLNFAVKYGMVRAGDARLSVEPGKTPDLYRFLSTAKSSRFFDTFFPVDDRVISEWSSSLRVPVHFEKHSREGKYKKDVSYRFDHDLGVAVYSNGRREKISVGSQDVLSAFYFVRAHKLVPGTTVEIPNHADGKNYELVVKVHERETVTVPAGRFACVVVEPLLRTSGLFKQEGRLLIWVTDDSRHMPVLMKSKIAVGSIVAELESFRLGRPPALAPSPTLVDPAGKGAPGQGNAGGQ